MPKKNKAAQLRDRIMDDLRDQLERDGTVGEQYADLVSDYMHMWDTKNGLIADIRARGVTVPVITAAGENMRRNDSVGDLIKLNAQMIKLLDFMGLKPSPEDGALDDEM